MQAERSAKCPYCEATVTLTPKRGRLYEHLNAGGGWCQGSKLTPDQAQAQMDDTQTQPRPTHPTATTRGRHHMKVIITCECDIPDEAVTGYIDEGLDEEGAIMQAAQDELGYMGIVVVSADVA